MKILAMVLAGGNGTRLHPLTAEHSKPALPFTGGYRIIDFVLGNLVNSGVCPIHVIVQYKPSSLIEHIRTAWASRSRGDAPDISIVRPDIGAGAARFRGTVDAVYQNLHLLERHNPDLVAVFAADHVYRMDVRQMAAFHQERGAEVSIAAVRVPITSASSFGVIAAGSNGELHEFQEKPERPAAIPDDSGRAYVSMGNYLFKPQVLAELLEECKRSGGMDFGHDVMPLLPRRGGAWAYDFASNRVPGLTPHEERGYWRDIGTIDAYQAAQHDVLGPLPRFNLVNPEWPIRGGVARPRRRVAVPVPLTMGGSAFQPGTAQASLHA